MSAADDYPELAEGPWRGITTFREQADAALNELDLLRADVSNLLTRLAQAGATWTKDHKPDRVTIAEIDAQRAAGWPDFHPEDYCHKCGARNIPSWTVDSDRFNAAFGPYDRQPYNGIVCPTCFVLAFEAATGLRTTWYLIPYPTTPFRPLPPTSHRRQEMKTPHSQLPRHCGACGDDWPQTQPTKQRCPRCGGLSCRADTTDEVAPDPPCAGSRHRLTAAVLAVAEREEPTDE